MVEDICSESEGLKTDPDETQTLQESSHENEVLRGSAELSSRKRKQSQLIVPNLDKKLSYAKRLASETHVIYTPKKMDQTRDHLSLTSPPNNLKKMLSGNSNENIILEESSVDKETARKFGQ